MKINLTFSMDVGWTSDFTTLAAIQSVWRKEQAPDSGLPRDALYHFMWRVDRFSHDMGPRQIVEVVPSLIIETKARARAWAVEAGQQIDDIVASFAVDASNDRSFVDHLPHSLKLGAVIRRIIITSGNTETIKPEESEAHVSRTRLITNLKTCSAFGRIKKAPDAQLEAESELRHELAHLQEHVTAAANLIFRTRAGEHDDLVMALAMACWLAERTTTRPGGPPPGMPAEEIRMATVMEEW